MTDMVSRPNWLRIRREPLPPSPIPEAAAETRRIADELSNVVDELARMNDMREAKLDERR